MAFFRKNLHKMTLLLTAVFWANCGAAEKQDIPQKESVKDSIKTAKQNIELMEFYYGVPFDYQQIIEIIDIEEHPYDIDEAIGEMSKQYSKDLLVKPSMKK